MINFIKSKFSEGLLLVLPLAASVTILKFVINIISKWLSPIKLLLNLDFINFKYSEFLITFLFLFLLGIIFTIPFSYKIYEIFEKIINKLPGFSNLYFGIKKILKLIFKKEKNGNEEHLVAWVKLPYRNIYCLGLMTTKLDQSIAPEKDKEFLCFFIPTTPNPISGYYIIADKNDCIFIPISREEAISMIMSGGIIKPDFVKK